MEKGWFRKNRVPVGSHLVLKVSPVAPPGVDPPPSPVPDLWTASLRLERKDNTHEASFANAQLRAGVRHRLTNASNRYDGPLVLIFAGPSSARVEIAVEKQDGSPHGGTTYDFVHSSAPADAVSIQLRMA